MLKLQLSAQKNWEKSWRVQLITKNYKFLIKYKVCKYL